MSAYDTYGTSSYDADSYDTRHALMCAKPGCPTCRSVDDWWDNATPAAIARAFPGQDGGE